MENEIAQDISKRGWSVVDVYDADPPFLYTIGLMETWNHPELILFGLESSRGSAILGRMIESIRNGVAYREPGTYSGVLPDEYLIGVRVVHPTQHPLYMGYAMGHCRSLGRVAELEAVQVFWPDRTDKYPFDVGCELEAFCRQPRLDIPLTPSEIAEFERQWE